MSEGMEFKLETGVKVQVVGTAPANLPYLRVEGADGSYLGSLDLAEMVDLRDALSAGLKHRSQVVS